VIAVAHANDIDGVARTFDRFRGFLCLTQPAADTARRLETGAIAAVLADVREKQMRRNSAQTV
jgi:hypothetical protein